MSTRSVIAIMNGSKIKSIYCHNDGYPKGVGACLLEHYTNTAKVNKLISKGDLSRLAKNIDPASKNHSFNTPEADTCVFYGRDRGDTNTEWRVCEFVHELFEDDTYMGCDYFYLMDDGEWFVSKDDNNWKLLKEVLN